MGIACTFYMHPERCKASYLLLYYYISIVYFRPFSNIVDTCSVRAEDRNDCGWYGIDQDTCEDRGCCYDDTDFGFETNWCFYPTG